MKHRTAVLFAVFFLCSAGGFLSAQTASAGLYPTGEYRSAEESFAAQEFRRGVQAFYRGSFNEAILQFEKSLSYAFSIFSCTLFTSSMFFSFTHISTASGIPPIMKYAFSFSSN